MQVICALVCQYVDVASGALTIIDPKYKPRAPKFPEQVWMSHAVGVQTSSRDRARLPTLGLEFNILHPVHENLLGPRSERRISFNPTVYDPATQPHWSCWGHTVHVRSPGEYTFQVLSKSRHINVKTKFQIVLDPASELLQDVPALAKMGLEALLEEHNVSEGRLPRILEAGDNA